MGRYVDHYKGKRQQDRCTPREFFDELGAKPEYWQGKLNFSGKWNSPIDCLLLIRGGN